MTEFLLFTAYLIGIALLFPSMISGADEMHSGTGNGASIKRELDNIFGHWSGFWIDAISTLSLVLWPALIIFGIFKYIKEKA